MNLWLLFSVDSPSQSLTKAGVKFMAPQLKETWRSLNKEPQKKVIKGLENDTHNKRLGNLFSLEEK